MVVGFFLLFILIFGIYTTFMYYGFSHRILPSYFKEKRELTLVIKEDILREAKLDPNFRIQEYIQRQNHRFKRVSLKFVESEDRLSKIKKDLFKQRKKAQPQRFETVPLKINDQSGYLVIYSKHFRRRLDLEIKQFIWFSLTALLISVIAGFFIFRRINDRTQSLLTAVGNLSRGDYQTRVNLTGNDEFSLIGQAFNEMAESIEKKTEELQAIDQQRRGFITDISHELSTPLTAIKGYVETLRMKELVLSEAETDLYLGVVWQETERLSYLVKDLLEVARLDAGTITLEREWIDLEQFLEEFEKRNILQLKEHRVEFIKQIAPEQIIYADYRRLEQILQNLLNNSLEHASNLSRVKIENIINEQGVMLVFKNDGSGIASEHLPNLFERFYRVPQLTTAKHSGLGLSIVKGLVELHGGTISVESSKVNGSIFRLTFPDK